MKPTNYFSVIQLSHEKSEKLRLKLTPCSRLLDLTGQYPVIKHGPCHISQEAGGTRLRPGARPHDQGTVSFRCTRVRPKALGASPQARRVRYAPEKQNRSYASLSTQFIFHHGSEPSDPAECRVLCPRRGPATSRHLTYVEL